MHSWFSQADVPSPEKPPVWVRPHGDFHEILLESESLAFSSTAWERLTDTAPGWNMGFSQEVEATLVLVADWEWTQAGGADLESWHLRYNPVPTCGCVLPKPKTPAVLRWKFGPLCESTQCHDSWWKVNSFKTLGTSMIGAEDDIFLEVLDAVQSLGSEATVCADLDFSTIVLIWDSTLRLWEGWV